MNDVLESNLSPEFTLQGNKALTFRKLILAANDRLVTLVSLSDTSGKEKEHCTELTVFFGIEYDTLRLIGSEGNIFLT